MRLLGETKEQAINAAPFEKLDVLDVELRVPSEFVNRSEYPAFS